MNTILNLITQDKEGNKWMDVGFYTEFFICTESELDKDKFTSRE